jgi:hypothetical protein
MKAARSRTNLSNVVEPPPERGALSREDLRIGAGVRDAVEAELRSVCGETIGPLRLVSESAGPLRGSRTRELLLEAERGLRACGASDMIRARYRAFVTGVARSRSVPKASRIAAIRMLRRYDFSGEFAERMEAEWTAARLRLGSKATSVEVHAEMLRQRARSLTTPPKGKRLY